MNLKCVLILLASIISFQKLISQQYSNCPKLLLHAQIDTDDMGSEVVNDCKENTFKTIVTGNFYDEGKNEDEILFIYKDVEIRERPIKKRIAKMYSHCSDLDAFQKIWSEDGTSQTTFDYWIADAELDKFVPGDYDGDGIDELLCISANSGYVHLVEYIRNKKGCDGDIGNSPNDWDLIWTNSGTGSIDQWYLGAEDLYYSGDFDGDNIDELLCINRLGGGYWHLYDYTNNNWSFTTGTGPSTGYLGGIETQKVNANTTVGKFANLGRDLLFMINNDINQNTKTSIQIYNSNTQNFEQLCGEGTLGYNDTDLSNNFTPSDSDPFSFLVGNFDEDSMDELLVLDRRFMFRFLTSDIIANENSTCGFHFNGTINFKGYNSPVKCPKYYEETLLLSGKFISKQHSIAVLYFNNDQSLGWNEGFDFYIPERDLNDPDDWLLAEESQTDKKQDLKKELQIENSPIKVFPNPAKNYINISISDHTRLESAAIFNSQGHKIETNLNVIGSSRFRFKTENLPSGIYFLSIQTGKEYIVKKVVIK